jgi:hypothetical protein
MTADPTGPPRRSVPAWLVLVPALTLVVGAALGFAVGGVPTPSPATATRPAAPPSTRLVVRHYASPACLETARRGDHLIDLLVRNRRIEAGPLLVAYTVAARQCRKDSTPTPGSGPP